MKKVKDSDSIRNLLNSQVLVAHTCNPSYSGGREQEDQSSKLAYETLSQKQNKNNKKGLVNGSGCKP
jgi:hypothetical protein